MLNISLCIFTAADLYYLCGLKVKPHKYLCFFGFYDQSQGRNITL